jgi:hypothetical protein
VEGTKLVCYPKSQKLDKDRVQLSFEIQNLQMSNIKHLSMLSYPERELSLIETENDGVYSTKITWVAGKNEWKSGGHYGGGKDSWFDFELVLQNGLRNLIKAERHSYWDDALDTLVFVGICL